MTIEIKFGEKYFINEEKGEAFTINESKNDYGKIIPDRYILTFIDTHINKIEEVFEGPEDYILENIYDSKQSTYKFPSSKKEFMKIMRKVHQSIRIYNSEVDVKVNIPHTPVFLTFTNKKHCKNYIERCLKSKNFPILQIVKVRKIKSKSLTNDEVKDKLCDIIDILEDIIKDSDLNNKPPYYPIGSLKQMRDISNRLITVL